MLGDKPIASLTEPNSDKARLCANIYPLARADILRSHPWNCLGRRVVLSPMVDAPAFEWSHQFTPPGGMLRIVAVGYDGEPEPYRFEGGVILLNSSLCRLHYLADVGEALWDANLVNVMVARMAKDLAYGITKSASVAEVKAREFDAAYRRAKTADAQENPPEENLDSPFLQARGR